LKYEGIKVYFLVSKAQSAHRVADAFFLAKEDTHF
jgi:hypothetical protein